MLTPKLWTTLKTYSREQFVADLLAGVIVAIVALPLAIAFAIASGVSPDKGLLTAIIAGFLISALGGSRVQIGGPTGAFVVIVYGIVQQHGVDGLVLATIMAGLILIAMGLLRFGSVVKYIPHPVVVGFTSGIALIIFSSQVKDFLGLNVGALPANFVQKWELMGRHLDSVNPYALTIALGTVLLISYWPRRWRKLPASFIALILTSLVARGLHWPVETIGSRFGKLSMVPHLPAFPALHLSTLQALLPAAFTIALLGAIESLLSAVVSDGLIGGRHRSNMELVAQGIANLSSGLAGGIPATGAIARTVTNIKAGGRTPVAGIVHSLGVLVLVVFLGRFVSEVPLACLAGILVVVSYHMSEWRSFKDLFSARRDTIAVLLITFGLTVAIDLTMAIGVGMVLSAILFMHRMAQVTQIRVFSENLHEPHPLDPAAMYTLKIPAGVEIFEINGPFFFGMSHEFEEVSRIVDLKPKVRILRLRHVPFIDATGIQSLRQFYKKCQYHGVHLILASVHISVRHTLQRFDLYEMIGPENMTDNIQEALKRAQTYLPA